MNSFEFSILLISVLAGLAAIVMWFDDGAMHQAEHDDLFHEHAHN